MKFYCFVAFTLIICVQHVCHGAVFGGVGIAGAAFAAGAAYHWGRCQFKECCSEKWIPGSIKKRTAFLNELKTHLFGQHLVMQTVPNAIYNHIRDENPKKALVMSFHGRTGIANHIYREGEESTFVHTRIASEHFPDPKQTEKYKEEMKKLIRTETKNYGAGKNHVARLIANHIYREGEESTFVHTRIASEHFPDSKQTEKYKEEIKNLIRTETKNCARSLFIFDEADKMPAGVMDVLKPYLDHYPKLDGVDYRKNIFLFLNNIGGDEISAIAEINFKHGFDRENIKTYQMEKVLSLTSLKEHGGLENSQIILSGLVDFFIPFLPLEKKHLKLCAAVDIKRRYSDFNSETATLTAMEREDIVNKAVNEIQYYPDDLNVFAVTGCKHVTKKVDMFL